MKTGIIFLLLTATSLFLCSCRHRDSQEYISQDSLREHLIRANRIMVGDESKEINEFITRHQWKMTTTGTGLRYDIYSHAADQNGKSPGAGSRVKIAYSAYLLDGTMCYAAGEKDPLTFDLGAGQQARGLEEGILMMHVNDKARFVVPSHLAYGMTGDGNKIRGKSALFYDVTLIEILN